MIHPPACKVCGHPVVDAKLAVCEPMTLACTHGSSWHGDGAKLLRELATSLGS